MRGIDFGRPLQVVMVNESGASVYSASDLAREELPDIDVSFRGSVSIARRFQDPLAELVKIDLRKDIRWEPAGRSIVTIPRGGSNDQP